MYNIQLGDTMTKIYSMKETIDYEKLKEASLLLKMGELVIFPTETVYGIGANALLSNSIDAIFKAKGRANDNPLIVHVSDFEMIEKIAKKPNEIEQKLMDAFMPGPFTLILEKKEIIPNNVSAGLTTVGIRMPSNQIAHDLIKLADVPIAAPSANLSSRPSGTNIQDIKKEFDGKVAAMIDGGETEIGIESTVVKVIDNIPTILRPGKITPEDIKEVIGIVKIDDHIFKKATGPVESPGMKYKHYAPNSRCLLLYSDDEDTLISLVNEHKIPNTTVIGFKEHRDKINCEHFYVHGSIHSYDEISHNIFKLLRQVDRDQPDLIIIEGVKKEGLGIAIMNRLIRSSSYHYIEK